MGAQSGFSIWGIVWAVVSVVIGLIVYHMIFGRK